MRLTARVLIGIILSPLLLGMAIVLFFVSLSIFVMTGEFKLQW